MDSIRLPDSSSIFTAEAKAIDIAQYHIRDQPEKQFIIYSDSFSVLRSLKNLDHRNPQIFRKYNYLSAFKEIVFFCFQATLTFMVTNLLIWKLNLLYHYQSPTWKILILISNLTSINMSWTNVSRFGKNKLKINYMNLSQILTENVNS